jgi:hypothetical protein
MNLLTEFGIHRGHTVHSVPCVGRAGDTEAKRKVKTLNEAVLEIVSFYHAESLEGLLSRGENQSVMQWHYIKHIKFISKIYELCIFEIIHMNPRCVCVTYDV